MAPSFNGAALTSFPLADGSSYYCPYFCAETGLDADELWTQLGRGDVLERDGEWLDPLWLDPAAPYMGYRGKKLARLMFFTSLVPGLVPKYSYSGYQHEALPHYHTCDAPDSRFVTETAARLVAGLTVNGEPLCFTQSIGTLYRDPGHNIGAHSHRPLDILPKSYIVDLSFGADREFLMRERSRKEQAEWIAKPQNKAAASEVYSNRTGRTSDALTMRHGSCILLSTSTNSRWTHEVPRPVGVGPVAPRASLIFRTIKTLLTEGEMERLVVASRLSKERAARRRKALREQRMAAKRAKTSS